MHLNDQCKSAVFLILLVLLILLKKKSLSDKITLSFQLAYAKSGFISGSGTWDDGPKLEVPVYGGNTNPKGCRREADKHEAPVSVARGFCLRSLGVGKLGGRLDLLRFV